MAVQWAEQGAHWPDPLARRARLRVASDERLTEEIRSGNEAAFEVAYERYRDGLLSMCRRMLGSREEAEEALQQSLTSAWYYLIRDDRAAPETLRPWLYAVARNRCLSIIAARDPATVELEDAATTGTLLEQVERRAELKALLADVRELPEEQRQALVLSEVVGLSHAQVAETLGRREASIKSIVFNARHTLTEWREARELPCAEVREQLSTLRGGSLRRKPLRRHLELCEGCRSYRAQVRARRSGLAAWLLPVRWLSFKGAAGAAGGSSAGAAGGSAAGTAVGATLAGLAPAVAAVSVASVIVAGGFASRTALFGGGASKLTGSPSWQSTVVGRALEPVAALTVSRAAVGSPAASHSSLTSRPRVLSASSRRPTGALGGRMHLSAAPASGKAGSGRLTTVTAAPTGSSPTAAGATANVTSVGALTGIKSTMYLSSTKPAAITTASKTPPPPPPPKPQPTAKTPPPPPPPKPQPTVKTPPPPPPPPPPKPQPTAKTPPPPPPPKSQPTLTPTQLP